MLCQNSKSEFPYPQARRSASTVWVHFLVWTGWVVTILLFMIDPYLREIQYTAILSLTASMVLAVRAPFLGLCFLPLPWMIGPIIAFPAVGIGYITAGDLYSATLIVRSLFIHVKRPNRRGRLIIAGIFFWLLLSAAFSDDLVSSIVGLGRFVQYALLTRIAIILIRNTTDYKSIFNSWVLITTICSIMMLWHFYHGRSNLIFWAIAPDDFDDGLNFHRIDLFFSGGLFLSHLLYTDWVERSLCALQFLIERRTHGYSKLSLAGQYTHQPDCPCNQQYTVNAVSGPLAKLHWNAILCLEIFATNPNIAMENAAACLDCLTQHLDSSWINADRASTHCPFGKVH
jgi:hypothetical protein